ncbi:glycosyltransferase family 4 protein [Tranquillimonas alkanivorans]|uniref:Glycosyltransferase involved in cell wall bisynthesis n=1 Tax=Tranquillimonas alkanivorans TaxID=441119 RepID=A0A1I5VQW1_9RHOB|nr:glycosyltransferase family 4 protein [Tranquillimonas alkanivorans]SFQ09842.1 Glycosyltransferase involved in cell wall bisynthesis [Tranquillimonas alkanivorans]
MTRPVVPVRHYGPGGLESGGGIGRFIGYVVNEVAKEGVRHLVVDTRGPRWSPLTSPLRLLAALAVMVQDRLVAPERIHHIHVAGRGSTLRKLILTAAARRLGCQHVLHLHDYDYASELERHSPRLRSMVRTMFRGADAVVVLGLNDRRLVIETLDVAADQVAVLNNCVPDPGDCTKAARGAPLILFLGRLSQRKGVPDLLAALARPEMTALAWRAVLAGDGDVAHYRSSVESLELKDRVELPGWLDEEHTAHFLRSADILVLPSHAEGMSMAVLEGLAHGLAVITTRVGAHEEVITDGSTGVFVPVGDAASLSSALAGLIRDGKRRDALSRAARTHFLRRFSMTVYMPLLKDVYDKVRERRRREATTSGARA